MQYPDEEKPIEAEYEIVSSGKERGRDEFKNLFRPGKLNCCFGVLSLEVFLWFFCCSFSLLVFLFIFLFLL